MKRGRVHYEALNAVPAEEWRKRLIGMSGAELLSLVHYIQGREKSERDLEILGSAIGECATRYLAKQIKKRRKVREIL